MKFVVFVDSAFKRLLTIIHTTIIKMFSNGITIMPGALVYYKSHVSNFSVDGKIFIGKNTRIGCSSKQCHTGLPFYARILIDGAKSSVFIGDHCRLNGAYIHAKKSITIGNKCVVAAGVNIIDSNAHQVCSFDRTIERDKPKEIIIGNNVWIGLNSIILKGTTIGDNSIISAGSVVKGVFPNNVIIAGNPATIVKKIIV